MGKTVMKEASSGCLMQVLFISGFFIAVLGLSGFQRPILLVFLPIGVGMIIYAYKININIRREREQRIAETNAKAYSKERWQDYAERNKTESGDSLKEKLNEIEKLKNEGVLTEEEYTKKREELIKRF